MMNLPIARRQIDKFDARPRAQHVLLGRLGSVAAMMEPVGIECRRVRHFGATRPQVMPGIVAMRTAFGRRAHPDFALRDQQVLGRVVSAVRVLGRPEFLARLGRQRGHRVLADVL